MIPILNNPVVISDGYSHYINTCHVGFAFLKCEYSESGYTPCFLVPSRDISLKYISGINIEEDGRFPDRVVYFCKLCMNYHNLLSDDYWENRFKDDTLNRRLEYSDIEGLYENDFE